MVNVVVLKLYVQQFCEFVQICVQKKRLSGLTKRVTMYKRENYMISFMFRVFENEGGPRYI